MKNKTNTMPTSNITTLSHNQIVRGAGFPDYTNKIKVGTVRGCALEWDNCPKEAESRAKQNGHSMAFTTQDPSIITADYPGKAEELAAKRARIDAAPELQDGQLVEIEGKRYKSRLVGHDYSDPIHFIPA